MTEASPVTHFAVSTARDTPRLRSARCCPTRRRGWSTSRPARTSPGEPGEFWIRGPQVMQGYLNDQEATAATLDADGWLRTGDIAQRRRGRRLPHRRPVKELIKYKGYQVPPAELEALLSATRRSPTPAVIPIPDEEAGEVPKAFVVAAGASVDRGRADGLRRRAGRAVQADPRGRVRRRDPEVGVRQDPAPACCARSMAMRRSAPPRPASTTAG